MKIICMRRNGVIPSRRNVDFVPNFQRKPRLEWETSSHGHWWIRWFPGNNSVTPLEDGLFGAYVSNELGTLDVQGFETVEQAQSACEQFFELCLRKNLEDLEMIEE